MALPVILGGPETGISSPTALGTDIFSTPIPSVVGYEDEDLLWSPAPGMTEFASNLYTPLAYLTTDGPWSSAYPFPAIAGGSLNPPHAARLYDGDPQPLELTNRQSSTGSFVASTHVMAIRRVDQLTSLFSRRVGGVVSGTVHKNFGTSSPDEEFTLTNDADLDLPKGALAFLSIFASRIGLVRTFHAPDAYYSDITSTDLASWELIGDTSPDGFHKLYKVNIPAGTIPALSDMATFTMGRGSYGLGIAFVTIDALMVVMENFALTTTPPLRQRQRDDRERVRGTGRNNPSSKQKSVRQGWRGTYL